MELHGHAWEIDLALFGRALGKEVVTRTGCLVERVDNLLLVMRSWWFAGVDLYSFNGRIAQAHVAEVGP